VSLPLDGRVAIVTGASRGIGRRCAEALAVNGARVVLGGRDRGALADAASGMPGAVTVAVDVAARSAPEQLIAAAEQLGRLDIVVNCAGSGLQARLAKTTDEAWDQQIAVSLTAPFRLLRAAEAMLVASPAGRVINISSVFAVTGVSQWTAYGAARGGLIAFSRSLAVEWARHGVCVNVVAPGHTLTDMTAAAFEEPRLRDYVVSHIPLGRLGHPVDISGSVAFLASDDASWITGQVLCVDGGWTAV
jgi:NAD(P)-dependent dehydrogenase (short-subunit alcohol dehydrogenase family)